MIKLTDLTYLIFEANSAIDKGRHEGISLSDVVAESRKGNVLRWLSGKLGKDIDLSLYDAAKAAEMNEALRDVAEALKGSEDGKLLVERNGLCLLIAYATELVQRRDWK